MGDPIKKITLKDGSVRYRFVIDIGRDPKTHKRRQLTRTHSTKKEARAEYAKIKHQTDEGTFVAPDELTVSDWLDTWLASATIDVERPPPPTTPTPCCPSGNASVTRSCRKSTKRTSTNW